MTKKPIFSITAKDCEWSYYNGTGKGGQHRNKKAVCVRCTHAPSGATGKSEDERHLHQNKRKAFRRMCETTVFQKWAKLESMRILGQLALIEEAVDKAMSENNIVTEVKDNEGRWVKV